MTPGLALALPGLAAAGCGTLQPAPEFTEVGGDAPYVLVLGTAQDAGSPQANSPADHPARLDPLRRRLASCLGIVDPRSGGRWMVDATPDFREQFWALNQAAPRRTRLGLDGVFLTHAHIGHYAGLVFLGHESIGAHGVLVFAMPRMAEFLRTNGPWDQLVRLGNIELRGLRAGQPVALADDIAVTPFLVPHRQEYSEVVGFRIDGPTRAVLYIPDIDSWSLWDDSGVRLEDQLATVDVAYLDGTFFADGEIVGRDMSGFPHPRIVQTMERINSTAPDQAAKVRFIHLNHTNPAQWTDSPERQRVLDAGFAVAVGGERVGL
ncbi:MAG: MBL fold metallo-hydrolase [Planctomycetota bacterium]